MMAGLGEDTKSLDETKDEVREPGMYHVIFLNDNYTPMDFVVEVLSKIFGKSENEAINIMMKVHNDGKAIVGTYIEDIAQTKSETVKRIAKDNEFPLKTQVTPA
jgi:ATP-dependent Clp protease adaptor protein ClpS